MANLILDHSNPPSPSLMYSSPNSSMSDSLEDSFMDYLQTNTHDNSNDFYSVAHSDGMQSPQPPTTPHSQSCFQSDQIIVPEGDLPRVEQNDVFDEKYKRVNQQKSESGADVETCIGCIRRERRRSQRKKENKQKPTERDIPDSLPPSPTSSSGKGADDNNVSSLEKCRVVAQGVSPAIMITDDHKSSKSKNVSTLKRNRAEFETLVSQQCSDPITPASSRKTSPQRQLSGTESSSTSNSAPTTPSPTNIPVSILPRSPKYAKVESDLNMTPIKSAPFMSIPHDTPELERTSHPLSATKSSFSANLGPVPTNDLSHHSSVVPSLSEYRHRLSLPTASNINLPPVAARRRRTLNSYNNISNAPGGLLSAIQWQSTIANTGGSNVPQLNRLIPAEGPLYGGVEITVLGSGFYDGLTCLFGETPALPTHCWSQNTLVCILPPATTPGTVVVSFKEHPLVVDGQDIVLFTYYDESDRALMELALQVVGLKMTGKLEDARQIAMRIVQGDNNQGNNTQNSSSGQTQQRNGGELEQQIIQALENVANMQTSFNLPVSQTNQQKHNMLHLAVMLGFTDLTRLLIQLGIHVDQQDRNGMTALHFASWTGKQDIVHILLDQGYANPDLVSMHAKTAMDLAMDAKHAEVIDALQWYQQISNSSSEESDYEGMSDKDDVDTQDRIVEWLSGNQVNKLDSDDEIIADAISSNKIEPVKPHEPQEPVRPRQFSDLSAWMHRTFGNKHKASLIPNSYPPNFLSGNRKLTTDEETSLLATAWYLAIASMMSSSSAPYQEKSSSHFIPMDLSVPGAALSSKNVIDLGDIDPDEADCYMNDDSQDDPVQFEQDRRLYLFWFPLLLVMIAILLCQYTEANPILLLKTSLPSALLA
ncbi:unnamed protein product [Umbelopsis sp. WA50703]